MYEQFWHYNGWVREVRLNYLPAFLVDFEGFEGSILEGELLQELYDMEIEPGLSADVVRMFCTCFKKEAIEMLKAMNEEIIGSSDIDLN